MSDDWTKAVDAWKAESKAADASRARGEPVAMPPPAAPVAVPLEPIVYDYDAPADGSAILHSLDGTFYAASGLAPAGPASASPDERASMRPGEASEVSGLAQLAASCAARR